MSPKRDGHAVSRQTSPDRERQGGRPYASNGCSARPAPSPEGSGGVPPGAPSWITPDLIADTLRVWQPYYRTPLTAEDALEMIMNVGQLFDVLYRE
jgi:hypothetical protein